VLPCLAAISPLALAGLVWMAIGDAGARGGFDALSRVLVVGLFWRAWSWNEDAGRVVRFWRMQGEHK